VSLCSGGALSSFSFVGIGDVGKVRGELYTSVSVSPRPTSNC
jgi:hypothetical protein